MNIPTRTEKAIISRLRNELFKPALELIDSEFVCKENDSAYNWLGEFLEHNAPKSVVLELLNRHPMLVTQLDSDNNCSLYHAVRNHRVDAVKELVMSGVDINKKLNGFGNCVNVAARIDSSDFLKSLLKLGADPFIESIRGDKPVDIARRWGNFENVSFLEAIENKPSIIDSLRAPVNNTHPELTL